MRPWLAFVVLALSACKSLTPPITAVWASREVGLGTGHVIAAAYGAGCFVIVGEHGAGARSCDSAETWDLLDLGVGTANMRGLVYAAGRFVAVGEGGALVWSSDGAATWEAIALPDAPYLRDVAYGAGRWVVAGDEGRIFWSPDLVRWTDASVDRGRWIGATFAGDHFVLSGAWERIGVSSDGMRWEVRGVNGATPIAPCELSPDCNDLDEIAEACGQVVAVTHPRPGVLASRDLVSWVERGPTLPAGSLGLWTVRAAGRYVAVAGHAGRLYLSRDCGSTWTAEAAGFTAGVVALAFGEGVLIAGGAGGQVRSLVLE